MWCGKTPIFSPSRRFRGLGTSTLESSYLWNNKFFSLIFSSIFSKPDSGFNKMFQFKKRGILNELPFKRCKFLIKIFFITNLPSSSGRLALCQLLVISVPPKWLKIIFQKASFKIFLIKNCGQFVCHRIVELLFGLGWRGMVCGVLCGLIRRGGLRWVCWVCGVCETGGMQLQPVHGFQALS